MPRVFQGGGGSLFNATMDKVHVSMCNVSVYNMSIVCVTVSYSEIVDALITNVMVTGHEYTKALCELFNLYMNCRRSRPQRSNDVGWGGWGPLYATLQCTL